MDPITQAIVAIGGPAVFAAAMWVLLREQSSSHQQERDKTLAAFREEMKAFRDEQAKERALFRDDHALTIKEIRDARDVFVAGLKDQRHDIRNIADHQIKSLAATRALIEKKLPDPDAAPPPDARPRTP